METKEEIRKYALELRAGLQMPQRRAAERSITERLVEEPLYENARCIYCYASFRDEVDTSGIIRESLIREKKVAVPRVTGRRKMEFYFIKSMADLRPGTWNIPEPGPWCEKAPQPDEETLIILPGAAFDCSGARIGYGGGFYDAYLERNDKCRKAALAFDVQCMDKIPVDDHDIRAEIIITEKELITCSQDYPETR